MRALHFVTGGSRLKLPTSLPSRCHIPSIFTLSYSRKFMVKMSIHSTPSSWVVGWWHWLLLILILSLMIKFVAPAFRMVGILGML